MTGWIKLHRSLLDWVKADDPEYMALWVRLLLLATHTPVEKDWGGKTITLQPGQFITSRKSLAKQSGISESKIERILERFKTEQQIEQQTNSVSRVITITYWSKYQEIGQQNEQPSDSEWTASGQRVNTNNNIRSKEDKEGKTKALVSDKPKLNQSIHFESFWTDFPNRTGGKGSKKDAEKYWAKQNLDTIYDTIKISLSAYKRCEQWQDPKYIPMVTTWLNQRRWESSPIIGKSSTRKTAGQISGIASDDAGDVSDLPF